MDVALFRLLEPLLRRRLLRRRRVLGYGRLRRCLRGVAWRGRSGCRLRSRAGGRWFWAGLLILAACSSLSPRAQRVAEGFIGLDASVVRKCLGDTVYLDIRQDGSELWAFAFGIPGAGNDIALRRVTGPGTAYARPAIETGTPTERRNAAEGAERLYEDRLEAGQCLHIFALADGRVQSYVGRGRSASGLNADSLCITLLEPCIDGVERGKARLERQRRDP